MKTKLQKKKDNQRSAYWKTKADKAWGKLIHSMFDRCAVDNGECSGNLEAHHLINRSNVCTRHSVDNGIILCSSHHKWNKYLSAHMAPLSFSEWLMMARPEQWRWASENKYVIGKPDYQQAYEDLIKMIDYRAGSDFPF